MSAVQGWVHRHLVLLDDPVVQPRGDSEMLVYEYGLDGAPVHRLTITDVPDIGVRVDPTNDVDRILANGRCHSWAQGALLCEVEVFLDAIVVSPGRRVFVTQSVSNVVCVEHLFDTSPPPAPPRRMIITEAEAQAIADSPRAMRLGDQPPLDEHWCELIRIPRLMGFGENEMY